MLFAVLVRHSGASVSKTKNKKASVERLEPPHVHFLNAALGWLELGNPEEAQEEIARIEPMLLAHPQVLEARWQICAALKSWDGAAEIAELLLRIVPESHIGWLHWAYALRRARNGGLEKARNALRPAYDLFPNISLIPYNLSCYSAQLGSMEESWEWFQKALGVAENPQELRQMALADADLKPIWEKIRAL